MADVARLVGMELRDYEKDGQKRQFCGLHLVYVEGSFDEVIGSRVEETSCPRGIDPNKLEVGKLYELGYEHYKMKGQLLRPAENAGACGGLTWTSWSGRRILLPAKTSILFLRATTT